MKRRILLALAALGLSAASGAVTSAAAKPAPAAPSHCATSFSSSVAGATCWGGSGMFRVVAYYRNGQIGGGVRYGPCTPIGYVSRAYASGIYAAGVQGC